MKPIRSARACGLQMVVAAAVLGLPSALAAQASPEPTGPLWSAYRRAAEVLQRALEVPGGAAAIRDLPALSFRWEGADYAPTQGRIPHMPWDTAGNARATVQDVRMDLAAGRYVDQREFRFGGGYLNAFRQLGRGSEFVFYNPYPALGMAGTVYQRDTTGVAARRSLGAAGANMPILLLRAALGRAPTLRYLGATTGDGEREHAITHTTVDGDLVTLYFDAGTHRLSRREIAGVGSLGDEVNTFHFSQYREVAGFLVPARMDVTWNGILTGRHRLVEFTTSAEIADSVFLPPAGYAAVTPAGPPAVVPIGERLAYVERLGGGYRMLVADTDDGLLVVDAPLSPDVTHAAIRLIEQAFPGRPIRYVVITHHHADHIGGIPAFAAVGATILVAPGSEDYIRRMSTVTRTFGRIDGSAGAASPEPRIETLAGRRGFSIGSGQLEVIDVGPTSHASAMLAVYVPGQRLLFQGDLLRINEHGGVVAAPDAARDLDRIIRQFGLDVQSIGAVHGVNGTIEDLRRALHEPAAGR